ncbi:NAD(P)-binding protein [Whalleya microplaca]|nr:NAD(P)-binding protein [Whalleya microplaca]
MGSIVKVALAGATGNLGPAILDQLLKGGFEVTVLTRDSSKHSFPASVKVKSVDYDSLDSLTNALQGQDAVVSTLASLALSKQLLLVDAAAKAGVKRFLPSEFGSNTVHPKTSQLPCFADKIAVQKALQRKAEVGNLTYTIVCNGPFFDWGLKVPFILNSKERSIRLYDGGNRTFSTTTLASIGKAVVGVLKHPDETKNRAVHINDAAVTLRKLLTIAEEVTGASWQADVKSVDNDLLGPAWAELKKEKPDPNNFVLNFIMASIWGEGYGGHFEKTDNELLGINVMTDAEIRELVERVII